MKKRPTLSAKTFTLSSYSEDIFDGFGAAVTGKPMETLIPMTLPASAARKRASTTTPALPVKEETIAKATSHYASRVTSNTPVADPNSQNVRPHHTRPKVPHDFSQENPHDRYCRSFKSSMLTAVISYHSRHKGLYGKTNRISYLRSQFDETGSQSVCPNYPPSYHGTGGESKSQAMGLTATGCPSSNSRTLHAPTTFGHEKLLQRSDMIHTQDIGSKIPPSQKNAPRSLAPKLSEDNSTRIANSFYDVLNISRASIPKRRPMTVPMTDSSRLLLIPTRYSANTEWSRPTQVLVQPVENSASFSPDNERLDRRGFVDTQNIRERNHKAAKINKIKNTPHRNAVSNTE